MIHIEQVKMLADKYNIPIEDVLFIALNFFGVKMDVTYNRMRMAFHLNSVDPIFSYASELNDLDYYFALAINHKSPFHISNGILYLKNYEIGKAIGATEDFCDSHYHRRLGTSLNINPNSRTSCRGCDFCYTAYQVPNDRRRMKTEKEIHDFFISWMNSRNVPDLSHLVQVSIVTGCYETEKDLIKFLIKLYTVLQSLQFKGRIFYLGSMLVSLESIHALKKIPSFGYCVSLECFERRHLLKASKKILTIDGAKEIMLECINANMEVNYTYILGIEPHDVFLPYMEDFLKFTTKFPTINILQLHQQHDRNLLDKTVIDLTYFLEARIKIESLFRQSKMRPLVWEDYRSLWYLKFGCEVLKGIRVPE
jgi:hypothetical protein